MFSRAVLPAIHQHINQGVADGTWTRERTEMAAIGPHDTVPGKGAVYRACDANGEAPESAGQCRSVLRFRDEMDVIVLNTENHSPSRHDRRDKREQPEPDTQPMPSPPPTEERDGVRVR